MKIIALLVTLTCFLNVAKADEYVEAHVTKNGTYVPGYYRTSPNGTTSDNYSHSGNVNPYTGKEGKKKK